MNSTPSSSLFCFFIHGRQNPEVAAQEEGTNMSNLFGILKVSVFRGTKLVVMDIISSDPYVVIAMGSQKVKTKTVKNDCSPVWNDEVSLAVDDLDAPIKMSVFDKDTFTADDFMGEANIDIKPYIEYLRAGLCDLPDGHVIHMVTPNRQNCLAEASPIVWKKGKLVQDMILRLNNVATGEIELQLEWVNVPGCTGLGS